MRYGILEPDLIMSTSLLLYYGLKLLGLKINSAWSKNLSPRLGFRSVGDDDDDGDPLMLGSLRRRFQEFLDALS
jgi:hypothetical protein